MRTGITILPITLITLLAAPLSAHHLARGDANGDGRMDVSDAVSALFSLYEGAPAPACSILLDADADGQLTQTDAVFVLNFLFLAGPEPAELTDAEEEGCLGAPELSFQSIQEKIFTPSCDFASCHAAAAHKGGIDLSSLEASYASLVGMDPENEAALSAGLKRVDPGKPETSFLLAKLLGPGEGEGNRMPSNSSRTLPEPALSAVREWILAGAPKDGTIEGVPDLGDVSLPPADRIPQPPVPENGLQIHLPPFAVGAHQEREIYYFMGDALAALPEDPVVERIDVHMSEDSHHFILYQWLPASNPPAGVRDTGSAFDIINGHRFMLGTQQSFFSLKFPPGVGLKFTRDMKFDLNSHFVNLHNDQTLQAEVYINFFFAAQGSITTFVKPIFDINYNINVPPNTTQTTKATFPMSASGKVPAGKEYHVYALGSHMHRHGVRFSTFLVQNLKDVIPPRMVYDNLDWDDPLFALLDPPLVLTAGQGLRFETTHAYLDPPSLSAPPLTFGLTSEDEMAIILGYYSEQ